MQIDFNLKNVGYVVGGAASNCIAENPMELEFFFATGIHRSISRALLHDTTWAEAAN